MVALSGAVLLGEIALRLTGFRLPVRAYAGDFQSRPSANFIVDPVTGWRMRPERSFERVNPDGERILYRADSNGFRRGEASDPRSDGPLIAVAGDSFAWGFDVQYEQAFGTLVARDLGGWRLANFAMPGFGLDQIWLSVREQALALRPDLVLVAIFLDDFERSRTAYREIEGFAKPTFALRSGELVLRTSEDAPGRFARRLESLRVVEFADAAARHAGRHVHVGPWWTLNEAILASIERDCEAAHVPLLFVHVPNDRWTPFPSLARWMKERGANYVDPTLLEPQQPPGLYFEADKTEHLRAAGHRRMSEWIGSWLREHSEFARAGMRAR